MVNAPSTLAEALAMFQADLPEVIKAGTAKVPTKTGGSYSYTYADLAAVTRVALPRLGKVGLSWTTKPTIIDGRFVLAYKLLHISGESEEGQYPLLDRGSPQEVGSAITYARRYALCSVTGIAPDDDDDGAAATGAHARNQQMVTRPSADPEPSVPTHVSVRSEIARLGRDRGVQPDEIAADFQSWSKGIHIGVTEDVRLLSEYLTHMASTEQVT